MDQKVIVLRNKITAVGDEIMLVSHAMKIDKITESDFTFSNGHYMTHPFEILNTDNEAVYKGMELPDPLCKQLLKILKKIPVIIKDEDRKTKNIIHKKLRQDKETESLKTHIKNQAQHTEDNKKDINTGINSLNVYHAYMVVILLILSILMVSFIVIELISMDKTIQSLEQKIEQIRQ